MVLLAGLAMLGACREAKRVAPQERVFWKPIAQFSGHGSTQTGTFSIETYRFRVKWEARNAKDPKNGEFRFSVNSAISGRPLVSTAVDHRGDGKDVAYVEVDPHDCYLVIDAPGTEWTVTVEEPLVEDTAGTGSPQG